MFGIFVRLASSLAVHADIWLGDFVCQDFLLHGRGSLLAASASEFAAFATQKCLHARDIFWEQFVMQRHNFCGAFGASRA